MQQVKSVQIGEHTLTYLKNAEDHAQIYDKDIISGTYQGGFTLWQCTVDLMNYINNIDFTGKSVLEIGCGHGLVGILALLKGAQSVCFADFNQDVINKLTMKNIQNNINKQILDKCSFMYGDWMNMQPLGPQHHKEFDIILGSEVIYSTQNYEKIIYIINNYSKSQGKTILANKLFYFGVGGSVPQFMDLVEEKGLKHQVLQEIVPETGNRKSIVSIFK